MEKAESFYFQYNYYPNYIAQYLDMYMELKPD